MEATNQPSGLTGINLPAIENELRDLWQQMAGETSGDAVMRACVLNLIAYSPAEHSSSDVSATLAEVMDEHPSRVLILMARPESPAASLTALVTAHCHSSSGGRQQVCCEQIVLKADGDGVAQIPSAVRPLLIPDLPNVLWWRDTPRVDNDVFRSLAELSSRVIVDSDLVNDTKRGLEELATLVRKHEQHTAFSDLTWSRLNPWRRLVAGFYDAPEWRVPLGRIGRVEIECGRSRNGQTGIPVPALLTASWLSSRLKWESQGHFEWTSDSGCQVSLKAPDRDVVIQINLANTDPGVQSVRLIAGGEVPAHFFASFNEDRTHLKTDVEIGRSKGAVKVAKIQKRSESFLIARELEIMGHDRAYEQALDYVERLAN